MEVINHGNRDWVIGLGKPVISDEIEYRLMKYVSKYEVDRGYVLLNNITSAMVYVWKSEYCHLFEKGWHNDYMRFLKENFFLVPLEYNDFEECEKLRKRFLPDFDKSICFTSPDYFTILSTTECNARCFYCYEKGRAQFPMTDVVANKVANFIVNIRNKEKPVTISWFGGEPTFNTKPMEIIYNKLIEEKIPFSSTMISNGYLIDEELCEKFAKVYNMRHIQITIDGYGDKYDKVKNYIYNNDESAFEKVMDNVERLLKAGIDISIRMNLDLHNAESLRELILYLKKRFWSYPNFSPYLYPIFEDTMERNEEHRAKVFKHLEELMFLLDECNFSKNFKMHAGLKLQHCMVDGNEAVLIGPKGDIGMCEHYTTNHFFSHIDNYEEKNWDEIKAFRTYLDPEELCKDCPLLPNCLRIDLCNDIKYCDKHVQKWRLYEQSVAARNKLDDYFNSRYNQQNCNCINDSCECKKDTRKKKTKKTKKHKK